MRNTPLNERKKTKIIATLGPASSNDFTLREMIKEGVDVIRLNASHAKSAKELHEKVALVRRVAREENVFIGIFIDLQGPKIRVGDFENNQILLEKDQTFIISTTDALGNQQGCSVDYAEFAKDVVPNDFVFIDDGKVQLVVKKVVGNDVHCIVTRGGTVSNHKGVNLPYTKLSMPAMTAKDFEDAKIVAECSLDYVALSFVSKPEDVIALRQYLDSLGAHETRIIAKIELQIAIDNIDGIIEVSDCIMVARGDLGVEIGVQNVPRAQKTIIQLANQKLKPVIVATQMLESMILSKVATRAEVSDVANAIYDGCDAVMLSGETAVGISPETVIKTMYEICLAADQHLDEIRTDLPNFEFNSITPALSFCHAADVIAEELDVTAIMAFTSTGSTPLSASKMKSNRPIIAPTDQEFVCNRVSLYRGITPLLIKQSFEELGIWTNMINAAIHESKQLQLLKEGDKIIITAGIPVGVANGINSIRMITVKDY